MAKILEHRDSQGSVSIVNGQRAGPFTLLGWSASPGQMIRFYDQVPTQSRRIPILKAMGIFQKQVLAVPKS